MTDPFAIKNTMASTRSRQRDPSWHGSEYRRLYKGERTRKWKKIYRDIYGLALCSLMFDALWIMKKSVLKTIYDGRFN